MFQDETVDPVSIQSLVKKDSVFVNGEVQTEPSTRKSEETQFGKVSHAATQTDSKVTADRSSVSYDETKLAEFLKRICPKVIEELDKAHQSRAFDRYSVDANETDTKPRKMHTLTPSSGLPVECKLSSLMWTCSGAVIALGYGAAQHDGWCDHRGRIQFFNINRPNFSTTTPNQVLETKSCVTCLSGHLSESSIIAAGLFNGEVVVWNLQWEEDCLLGSSETTGGGHEDEVIKAEWICDPSTTSDAGAFKVLLVTAGMDGRLILWRLASQTGGLRRGQGFGITSHHLAPSAKGRTSIRLSNELLPITSFSFVPNDSTSFVVAVEGGALFRCSTLSTKVISGLDPDFVMNDPVISSFESHSGRVCDLQFSPNQHNLFLCCSSDGEIRSYNMNQVSPLQIIQFDKGMVKGISWSPTNSDVFLCWGEDSNIYVYDLSKPPVRPVLPLEGNNSQLKLTSAAFNPLSSRTVAIADEAGHVNIWYLPERMEDVSYAKD